ncbi:hypothetical protein QTP88_000451 [Uroleucon formosanum]
MDKTPLFTTSVPTFNFDKPLFVNTTPADMVVDDSTITDNTNESSYSNLSVSTPAPADSNVIKNSLRLNQQSLPSDYIGPIFILVESINTEINLGKWHPVKAAKFFSTNFTGITNIKPAGFKKVKITFDSIENGNMCLKSAFLSDHGFSASIPSNLIYSLVLSNSTSTSPKTISVKAYLLYFQSKASDVSQSIRMAQPPVSNSNVPKPTHYVEDFPNLNDSHHFFNSKKPKSKACPLSPTKMTHSLSSKPCYSPPNGSYLNLSPVEVYKAIIRSKLDYGCFLFGSASFSNWNRLNKVQSSCLRCIMGYVRSSPLPAIEVESSCPPSNIRCRWLAGKFLLKSLSYSSSPIFDLFYSLFLTWRYVPKNLPVISLVANSVSPFHEYILTNIKLPIYEIEYQALLLPAQVLLIVIVALIMSSSSGGDLRAGKSTAPSKIKTHIISHRVSDSDFVVATSKKNTRKLNKSTNTTHSPTSPGLQQIMDKTPLFTTSVPTFNFDKPLFVNTTPADMVVDDSTITDNTNESSYSNLSVSTPAPADSNVIKNSLRLNQQSLPSDYIGPIFILVESINTEINLGKWHPVKAAKFFSTNFTGITNIKPAGFKKVKITFDSIENGNMCLKSAFLSDHGFSASIPSNLIYSLVLSNSTSTSPKTISVKAYLLYFQSKASDVSQSIRMALLLLLAWSN